MLDTGESKALKQSRQENKRLEDLLKQRVNKKEVAHHVNVIAGLKKQLAAKTSELQELKEATCLTVSPHKSSLPSKIAFFPNSTNPTETIRENLFHLLTHQMSSDWR